LKAGLFMVLLGREDDGVLVLEGTPGYCSSCNGNLYSISHILVLHVIRSLSFIIFFFLRSSLSYW
jgi:hypothetical protein